MKLVLTGVPRAGKTTLAGQLERDLGLPVRHTDDLASLPWSEASERVVEWMAEPGPWLIEGVAAVRALRKFLSLRSGLPCTEVYWMPEPHPGVPVTPGQQALAKGTRTIWTEIETKLRKRGVRISTLVRSRVA